MVCSKKNPLLQSIGDIVKNLRSPIDAFPTPIILAAITTVAIMACESFATTPTTPLPPNTPTTAPTANITFSTNPLDHTVELLTWLPTDRSAVWFVEFGKVSQRPSQQDSHWEDQLLALVRATDGTLNERLVKSAAITTAAFSFNSRAKGTAILRGDFSTFPKVLREAATKGAAVLYTHREVEIFAFQGRYDLYLAVMESDTLLLARNKGSFSRKLLEEAIDRRLDGATLDEPLARLLKQTSAVDFLVAQHHEPQNDSQGFPSPNFFAGAGRMNEGDTSTLHFYSEYDNAEQAAEAESLMNGQHVSSYSTGENYPITGIRRHGKMVIARVVVPDIDVEGFLLGH